MWNATVPGEPNDRCDEPETTTETFDEIVAFIPAQAGTTEAPLCDQANVDKRAADWSNLWEAEQSYIAPMFDLQLDMFKGTTPKLCSYESVQTLHIFL